MACQRPLKGFLIGETENGKPKYKVCQFTTHHVEKDDKNMSHWIAVDTPYYPDDGRLCIYNWIPIPCGKCYACRRKMQRDWTCRMILESRKYPDDKMWFLTLTYDEQSVPLVLGADSLGEATFYRTLKKRDLQLFWKRLRSKLGECRYFACGEYSPKGRPHYHAIVFGLDLSKCHIRSTRKSKTGEVLYEVDELSKLWHEERGDKELGFLAVGSVNEKSMAYVAGYCLKKSISSKEEDYTNRVSEFTAMSRNPGIGSEYVPEGLLLTLGKNTYTLPRYFRKKDKRFDADVSKLAQITQINLCRALGNLDISDPYGARRYLEYLKGEERNVVQSNYARLAREF